MGSKYISDTFVNFIVIYDLLRIILDFYMTPIIKLYVKQCVNFCHYLLFFIL